MLTAEPFIICLSGGIGSGKSVVARILRIIGYPVFDCDSHAKIIMERDKAIHARLCNDIHHHIVVNGVINRPLLSDIVFSSPDKLDILNSIVHQAVFRTFDTWSDEMYGKGYETLFVESAILRSSGLLAKVHAEWRVTAPVDVRLQRVGRRSGLSPKKIMDIMRSQQSEESIPSSVPLFEVCNDGDHALLPRIHELLNA